jgi:4-amino-4-deoxy-L-arabinose transferase-like glycosyltransferase
MASGTSVDWWLPSIAGEPLPEEGPLPFWLGALFAQLLGPWLGQITAARLVTVFWFVIGTWALWYATYRLARRDEAQPVALAFGGEASPRDYGRMLADVAVLFLTATFGVLVRFHETGAEPALLALVCITLFGLAFALDDPWKGTVVSGLAIGAIVLSRGWLPAAAMLVAAIAFTLSYGEQRAARAALVALLAFGVFSLWPLLATRLHPAEARSYFEQWWQWNRDSVGAPRAANVAWIARNVGWYAWPLWPFAFWTIYSWRHFVRRPHIALPLLTLAVGLAASLVSTTPSDREFLLTVPALVILATFGVTSLKRSAEDAIDWFSLAVFSFALITAWLAFTAWMAGSGTGLAAPLQQLAPGFEPTFRFWPLLLAGLATATWIGIVVWRVRVRPPMIWTGPFIAATGLAVSWIVAIALFARAIDHARTQAPIAPILAEQIRRVGGDTCVQPVGIPLPTRAMLAYHGKIRFETPADAGLCRVALQRDSRRSTDDDAPPSGRWEKAYELTRRTRYDETFRIWVRSN